MTIQLTPLHSTVLGPELSAVPDDHPFRREFRRWLEDHGPGVPEPLHQDEKFRFRRAWQRTLFEGGWAGPAWPERFGGRGVGALEQFMYYEELALARAPQPVNAPGIILHTQPSLEGQQTTRDRVAGWATRLLEQEVVGT